ncbi:uncharacterized protein VTP21DRAFT_3815 [Calcarisporiella thermophila]|uniref:uncharacterized protein n=1 Tax=Calcarisporiella thermophila TaxID=911321 RepID=UPI0037440401
MLRTRDTQNTPRYQPYIPGTRFGRVPPFLIRTAKYSTSLDPRGFIPVYEFTINDQVIMWDRETGEVHFTGIWKALGNSKTDIVRMIDSNPDLPVKKIRGGFLRIQGTWIPFEYAELLARRTCYEIRYELVPLFGPRFPDNCLRPGEPGFGCLLLHPDLPVGRPANLPWLTMPPPMSTSASSSRCAGAKTPSPTDRLARLPRGMELLLNRDEEAASLPPASPDQSVAPAWRPRSFSEHTPSTTSRGGRVSPSSVASPAHVGGVPVFRGFSHDGSGGFHPVQDHPHASPHPPHPRILRPITFVPKSHLPSVRREAPPERHEHEYRPPSTDALDTMTATLLLQRLSQDDGQRPFKPWHETELPRSVVMEEREFAVVWKE